MKRRDVHAGFWVPRPRGRWPHAHNRRCRSFGFLGSLAPRSFAPIVAAFLQGLKEGRLSSTGRTSRSSTAGQKDNSTGCRRWQLTSCSAKSRSSLPAAESSPARRGSGVQRRRFRSSLRPPTIRWRAAWSQASIDRAATSPASTGKAATLRGEKHGTAPRAGAGRPLRSPCSSIRTIRTFAAQLKDAQEAAANARQEASGLACQARRTRSTPLSTALRPGASRRTGGWHRSAVRRSAQADRRAWQRAMQSRRSIFCENSRRPAGS